MVLIATQQPLCSSTQDSTVTFLSDRATVYALFASTRLAVLVGGQTWKYWHAVTGAFWNIAYRRATCSFDEFASQPWAPIDLMAYCRKAFEYDPDPVGGMLDNMQPPWVFLQRKRGDCEDWSNLMMHVLRKQGKQAWLFFVFSPTGGHCVCFFREGSTWSHISNRGLKGGFETWDEMLADVSRDWLLAYLVGPNRVLIPIWRGR